MYKRAEYQLITERMKEPRRLSYWHLTFGFSDNKTE